VKEQSGIYLVALSFLTVSKEGGLSSYTNRKDKKTKKTQ